MKMPPYAKELAQARRQGMVPDTPTGLFLVALGWRVHHQLADHDTHPRIVLPLDVAIQNYDLRPLAGLDLLLVYDPADWLQVDDVADCLMAINPHTLCATPINGHGRDWTVYLDGPWPSALTRNLAHHGA